MKTILHHLRIHADSDTVFAALTTTEGLGSWWSTRVRAEAREGGLVDFTFVGDFNPDMQVTAFEPGKRVGWLCVSGHDNWRDNRFTFDLTEIGPGETDLTFRQHYAVELDDATYGTYNFNWGYYLNSLKQYCETGAGTPFEPE